MEITKTKQNKTKQNKKPMGQNTLNSWLFTIFQFRQLFPTNEEAYVTKWLKPVKVSRWIERSDWLRELSLIPRLN